MTDEIHQIIIVQAEAAKRGVLTIWTVYEKPRDYPTGWIARMHEVGGAVVKPTGYVIKAVELEPIREKLARAGLVCIPRQEGDERQIVESWIMTGEIIPKGEPGLGTALAENDGNIAKVPELRAFCF